MARMIQTVTGPVPSDQLGGVLCHEHVLFGYPGYQGDITENVWDEERFIHEVEPVVAKIKQQGIKTIVDATPNDMGRDVEILKRFSERCGINVICSTGYYYEHGGAPAYWRFRKNFGFPAEEELYALFQKELEQGVAQTGIRAGVIKVGTGIGEMSDYERMMFTVAAHLARENPDVRIITHCTHGTMLKEQADFFLQEGVNPRQVQLGHFCDTTDLSTQMYCLEKGFYAGFDRMGQVNFDGMPDDEFRLASIAGLVSYGYGEQILLSNDRLYWIFGREFPFPEAVRENLIKEWHWTYIFDKVLPRLETMGLREEQTHRLMFENPQRFYGGD